MGFLNNAGTEMLWKKTKKYADDLVDEVEIGGRNYFTRKSTNPNGLYAKVTFDKNNEFTLMNYDETGCFNQFYNLSQPMKSFVGKKCILSLDAISPDGDTQMLVYNYNNDAKYVLDSVVRYLNITTEWNHFELSFTPMESASNKDEFASNKIELYCPNNQNVRVRNIKFEIGTKATDWTPAPEDLLQYTTNYAKSDTPGGQASSAKKSNAVVDYNNENRNIQIGFNGAGLTAANLAYLAGYTADGKIKDITIPNAKYALGFNNLIQNNDMIQSTNSFSDKKVYISKLDNAYYCADKRWTVTGTYEGDTTGEIADTALEPLFDGSYETSMCIPVNTTAKIRITFDKNEYSLASDGSKIFPGYAYGQPIISYYWTYTPATQSKVRMYSHYEPHGIGEHEFSFTAYSGEYSDATADVGTRDLVESVSDIIFIADISYIEFEIAAPEGHSVDVTQIEMNLQRPAPERNPFVGKYTAEKLFYPLTAPDFLISNDAEKKYSVSDQIFNELPAKFNDVYALKDFNTVPANSDLNGYITPGTYGQAGYADAKTIANLPYDNASGSMEFKLLVEYYFSNNATYIIQRLTRWNSCKQYVRETKDAGKTWSEWHSISMEGHTHSKSEVGLGNVDNIADSEKSVKYAASAGSASKVNGHTVNADVPADAEFTDTTYSTFQGTEGMSDGTSGLVPAPKKSESGDSYALGSDGNWKDLSKTFVQQTYADGAYATNDALENAIKEIKKYVDTQSSGGVTLDSVYPVGSIYISVNDSFNPNNVFPGTWVSFGKGRTLVGVDRSDLEFQSSEDTGGEKTHALTVDELPTHNHSVTIDSKEITGSVWNFVGQNANYGPGNSTSGVFSKGGDGTCFYPSSTGKATGINDGFAMDATHSHTASASNTGSGVAHNNMMPYITVRMWKRTA